MVPMQYYEAVILSINSDSTLTVRYPDEGRFGIEDDSLPVDLVDLQAHANAQLFKR